MKTGRKRGKRGRLVLDMATAAWVREPGASAWEACSIERARALLEAGHDIEWTSGAQAKVMGWRDDPRSEGFWSIGGGRDGASVHFLAPTLDEISQIARAKTERALLAYACEAQPTIKRAARSL